MNCITNKVEIKDTGIKVPKPFKLFSQAINDRSISEPLSFNHKYIISASYQTEVSCDRSLKEDVLLNAVNLIIEGLYGPLKKDLLELERCVYEEKTTESLSRIRDILRRVSFKY